MYRTNSGFSHEQKDKLGVLLVNLGTPDQPEKQALRRYLKEFLSDPRVVEVPRAIWWFILNGVILNFRPARSAKAYKTVWTDEGSPLLIHTKKQAEKLQTQLTEQYGDGVMVKFAMRYGNPSITNTIDDMLNAGVRKLLVLPLYPQYCGATTASTFDAIAADFTKRRWLPDFRFISHYHDNPLYIKALADKVRQHWQQHGQAQKLLMSYHGIPKRYLTKGDPYYCECHKTSRLLAEELGLNKEQYLTCFQSRFGREEWLNPYTDETLKALPQQGIKSVDVVCPGFSADCLETIEEIGEENREYFIQAGGETYHYIEALNSDQQHIHVLANLVADNIAGWSVNFAQPRQRSIEYKKVSG
ncbi:ferrochelatase [Catenovulum agarivorans DS-2]|uniref:Ferrochelatase n=1 Tax=Catenovulum agarivorans DS-2 TaxID=1328313 RepID=W7QVG2_9ALTE|nr:ferrochelatase [Catenovulum agarivorans]EWH09280.1 ferrochelatase [Catenovulum agarivorans DS-2]